MSSSYPPRFDGDPTTDAPILLERRQRLARVFGKIVQGDATLGRGGRRKKPIADSRIIPGAPNYFRKRAWRP
jgi:hypothetical protein